MTESQKHREFVESKWEIAEIYHDPARQSWQFFTCNALYGLPRFETRERLYQAGYDFTISHLEAIRQIEEEINLQRHVRNYTSALNSLDFSTIDRTLGRLEAWRDEMKRGMR